MAVALLAMTSCATPVVVYRSPGEALAAEYGRALRLETTSGERYTIYQGRVHDDTLYAVRPGRRSAPIPRWSFPFRQSAP